MDNYQVNWQAREFSTALFARPESHARARLVGVAALVNRHAGQVELDDFLALPFTVDQMLDGVARACAAVLASATAHLQNPE
jgi:hypothetical protein